MPIIRPFCALRPRPDIAHLVASLPYDVMNPEEARKMAADNPLCFLHVTRAEIDLPNQTNPHSDEVYEKARENFNRFVREKILEKDQNPSFYVYALTMHHRRQAGLVACCSIDDYVDDIIRKHEHTRPEKENDRIRHMQHLSAQTGPIFLTFKDNLEINDIIKQSTSANPIISFVSNDEIQHEVWQVKQAETIQRLMELFEKEVTALYIADGHHRAASAVKVGMERRKNNPLHTGTEPYNYFLAVLFPASQLQILDYNRVVKDLNGKLPSKLIEEISVNFEVQQVDTPYKPESPHLFGMYLDFTWYKLTAKPNIISNDPIGSLDVSILQDYLLGPLLGIDDPRTNKRIDFVGGIRGLSELEKRVNSGEMAVAFSLYPVSLTQLMAVSDAGCVMPPKSTWFEPKLRDGLFVHLI
ncbi:MAG: DUF1015 family protein [Chitinophagales bacterium]|nr:DUF1015 family protein [Chitinophagales bacterium]MDW8274020.1 DUF1015 family protein [Chitinophagales bacterium]